MNMLDLTVLNAPPLPSPQARQQRMAAHTLDELVQNVKVVSNKLPTASLGAGFLTLQCVMDDCAAVGG